MTGEGVVLRRTMPGFCLVRVRREGACGKSCEHCKICGDAPPIDISARNRPNARRGQRVRFESATSSTLGIAALVYLLPVVLFLAGYLIHPVCGAAGLLFGLLPAFAVNRKLTREGGVSVVITDILD